MFYRLPGERKIGKLHNEENPTLFLALTYMINDSNDSLIYMSHMLKTIHINISGGLDGWMEKQ